VIGGGLSGGGLIGGHTNKVIAMQK